MSFPTLAVHAAPSLSGITSSAMECAIKKQAEYARIEVVLRSSAPWLTFCSVKFAPRAISLSTPA